MKYNPDIVKAYFASCYLPEPLCEHRFHPTRRWRFDFAWPQQKVALEVEGLNGRHQRTAGFLKDMEKYNRATVMGWRVLRTTNRNLCMQETVDMIRMLL